MIQLTGLSVQCDELVTIVGTFNDDMLAMDRIQIVGMHRLTVFFHNIVCNIDQIIDRTDADRGQAFLHPLRGWTDLDILYNSGYITRAEIICLYGNFHIVFCFFIVSCYFDFRCVKRHIESSRCLTGHTKYTVAVHTVGCDLIFYDRIVKSQKLNGICANFRIVTEHINAVLRCFRMQMSVGTQLLNGTHHTAGFHTAEFAFFDLDTALCAAAIMTTGNTATI